MIGRATQAREAGDWWRACQVSDVDVGFDLRGVAGRYGSGVADALADDLRHLAPDLVRWHLLRKEFGDPLLVPRRTFVLAAYGQSTRHGPCLMVHTPTTYNVPQRLRLDFGEPAPYDKDKPERNQWWTASRHLWHARHTDELRARCGGGDRTPFFERDGRVRDTARLPTGPCPDDPTADTEWFVTRYQIADGGDLMGEVLGAVGVVLDAHDSRLGWPRTALAVRRLATESRMLRDVSHRWLVPLPTSAGLVLDVSDPTVVRGQVQTWHTDARTTATMLPDASWRQLPDLVLLHAGRITPDELHPLVCRALFPDHPPAAGPPPPRAPEPVRVRCRGEWHTVQAIGGRLAIPHSDAEVRREQALVALDGPTGGCFAVQRTWLTGSGRLPRQLRAQRQDMLWRAQLGDTHGVLALLDAGMSPTVRNGSRQTLLHLLYLLDHEVLLPRLLAAGLDLETRDDNGRTPLHAAVGNEGSPAVIRALVDAGAAIAVVDAAGVSVAELMNRHSRKEDLDFLAAGFVRRYRRAAGLDG